MGFNKIKYIMKSGGLTKNSHLRNVHMKISKTNDCPKCAACLYGNQVRRSDPGKIHSQDVNKQNVLKKEDLLPGQTISVDHFIIRTPGRLIEGNGQKKILETCIVEVVFLWTMPVHIYTLFYKLI